MVIALAGWLSFKYGYRKGQGEPIIPQRDTIVVVDTELVVQPVPEYHYIDRPVYYPVHDTTTINDTTYIVLQREVKVYSDSTYRAQVSGVEPSLDWIEVYQRTQTITNYVVQPRKRWSFSVTAGPGVLYDGGIHGGIGVVAGLSYNF